MSDQPVTLPPRGYEYAEPRQRWLEFYGAILVMNRYLRIVLAGMTVVAVALVLLNIRTHRMFENWRPLVIRIDEIGRASTVSYASLTYTPQAPELKYFLVQFVTKHYSRLRATVRLQYAESLYFLDGRLADATIEAGRKSGAIERFLAGDGEEVDVHVTSVALDDLRQPPYRATIEFDKTFLAPATRAERRRERYVAHVVFVISDHVENSRIPVNPLGLTIVYFREDQAFVPDDRPRP